MTTPDTGSAQWTLVDEGWGRKAVDFATLSEPGNCREYVTMHHRLGVDAGDRLLDVACGSGLAIELARMRGAAGNGIDASPRLVAVARDRNPGATSGSATCTRCPGTRRRSTSSPASAASGGRHRTRWPSSTGSCGRADGPGSRSGVTSRSRPAPGHWRRSGSPRPRRSTTRPAMVSLGRPGAGEQLLASYGLTDIERVARAVRLGIRPTRRSTRGRWPPPGPAYEPSSMWARPNSIAQRSNWPRDTGGTACRSGPNQRRGLPGPQTRRGRSAHERQLPRGTGGLGRSAGAVRRGPRRRRLRVERDPPVGASAGHPQAALRPHVGRIPGERARASASAGSW